MPPAPTPSDSVCNDCFTASMLQRLTGWNLDALRQLWQREAFPIPIDPDAVEPRWRADLVFDWLHIRSESQAEAARFIREHHASIYQRSVRKWEDEWRDVEEALNKAVADTDAILGALDEGAEVKLCGLIRRHDIEDEESMNPSIQHYNVEAYPAFKVAELKHQRALETVDELTEANSELVIDGSEFQAAYEELLTATQEYRHASKAFRREVVHLTAIGDVAREVFAQTKEATP